MPLSKEASTFLKGGAICLMLITHLIPDSRVTFGFTNIFTGVCCLAFFAFLSGYAHALMSEKHKDLSFLRITGKSFLGFYQKYLLCSLWFVLALLVMSKINIYDTAQILIPLKPNIASDPWWYVFCHMVFCFLIFPAVRRLDNVVSGRWFFIILFFIIIIVILLPLTFSLPFIPENLKNMYGGVPTLRTIMITPYYLIGYLYFKHIHHPEKLSGMWTFLPLVFFAIFPFSLYGIPNISAINIGISFIICSIILRVLYMLHPIKSLLCFLGTHSLYIWLLHMPICICFSKLPVPQNSGIRFFAVFALSVLAGIFLAFVDTRIHRYRETNATKAD